MFKSLIIAAVAFLSSTAFAEEAPINYSLLVYGSSIHMDRFGHADQKTYWSTGDRKLNGINPGIGIEAERDGWLLGAGSYRDSFYKQAYMAYGGYRFNFGDPHGWNYNIAIKAGYLDGSGHKGLMALPTVGIGYKKVSLEFTAFPYHCNGNGGKGVVIATWLRYNF